MSEEQGRARRQPKAPSWMQEVEDIDKALAGEEAADEQPMKYIWRLITKADVNRTLVGRQIYVFWEDYDLWYRGKIKKIDFENMETVIFYPDTEEEEPDANLGALIDARQLAFKETRPADVALGPNELDHAKEFAAPEKRKRGRPPKGQERPREPRPEVPDEDVFDDDDEEEPLPEDSDPSYSGEDRGRKRGRGGDEVGSGPRPARAAAAGRGRWQDDEAADAQRLLAQAHAGAGAAPHSEAAVRDKVRNTFTQVLESAAKEAMAAAAAAASGAAPGAAPMAPMAMPMAIPGMPGMTMSLPMGMPGLMPGMMPGMLPGGLTMPGMAPAPVAPAPAPVAPAPAPVASEAPAAAPVEPAPAPAAAPALEAPKPAAVATVVEDELARLYGGTTKAYKDKVRSLQFNLKGNAELRAALLRGDVTPAAFVRMTPEELATKELAAYRAKKEEEALKMAVLDAEAAAKFSTAAALDARDALAAPNDIVTDKLLAAREGSPAGEAGGGAPPAASPRGAAAKKSDDAERPASGEAPPLGPPAPSPAAAIDWASVRAEAARAKAPAALPTLPDSPSDDAKPSSKKTKLGPGTGELSSPGSAPPPRNPLLPDLDGISSLFLPARSSTMLRPAVWTGEVEVPGVGGEVFGATVDALAGGTDLAALLGPGKLHVRGRVSTANLASFLSQLRGSKHRAAMLGVLRAPPAGAAPSPADLVANYAAKDRAGVSKPIKGVEIYLVPPSALASRLLEAGQEAEPGVAAGMAVARGAPSAVVLRDDHMVVMVVYLKDMAPLPTVPPAAVPLPAGPLPVPMAPLGAPPMGGPPPPYPMAPSGPMPMAPPMAAPPGMPPAGAPPPAPGQPGLPAGLDLSAISALAAAFGVAPQPPQGPPPQ